MATPQKYKDGWRVQLKVGGIRESATFKTKTEASTWAARRKLELQAESKGTAGDIKTFGDVLKKYRDEVAPTHKGQKWETTRVNLFLADPDMPTGVTLSKLTTDHFNDWKKARLHQVSSGTVLRELSLLGSVLNAARLDWRWMKGNPLQDLKKPKEPPHRDRIISWSEQRIMLRTLGYSPRKRQTTMSAIVGSVFLVALRTGMRAGEIVGLTWDKVQDSWLILTKTKNGKKREVPLPPKAKRLIENMRGLDDEFVFPVKGQTLDALFRRARIKAGLEGFTFHDTRHTAATRIGRTVGQAGKLSFVEFCKVFGWSDPRFALVYVNPTAADLAKKMG